MSSKVAKKEDALKEAMLVYAPQLAEDYKDFVRSQFKAMHDELGDSLKGVYNSRRWARAFQAIQSSLDQKVENYRDVTYSLDADALRKNAKEYGDRVSLEWYNKLNEKLGDLTDVKVSPPNRGGDVVVDGRHGADRVHIVQQRVFKTSQYGTPFHQFPALIYVNDKFHSEAQYKKRIGARVIEKPVTQYRCGACGYTGRMGDFRSGVGMLSCPKCRRLSVGKVPGTGPSKRPIIDPDSRPKDYKFEFKVDYIGTPSMPHNYGRTDTRQYSAKGMTVEEAWEKVHKQEMRSGYYSKVYDQRVIAIFAWNDRPIWRESSGESCPVNLSNKADVSSKQRDDKPLVRASRKSVAHKMVSRRRSERVPTSVRGLQ